jgi:hypothetical protein
VSILGTRWRKVTLVTSAVKLFVNKVLENCQTWAGEPCEKTKRRSLAKTQRKSSKGVNA